MGHNRTITVGLYGTIHIKSIHLNHYLYDCLINWTDQVQSVNRVLVLHDEFDEFGVRLVFYTEVI